MQSAFSPAPPTPWAEEVRCVVADLRRLNETTEAAFLTVGGNLMSFLSASQRLHSEMAGLSGLVSGGRGQEARDALLSVLAYVRQMQQKSKESGRALAALTAGADCIRREFSTFRKIVLSFRVTAIASRIEVAHISASQQNLESLAADVQSCVGSIEALGVRILEAVADFVARIGLSLEEVSRLEAGRLQELPALLDGVSADLDAFRDRERDAAQVSSDLAAKLDSVTRDLGAVAVSIQFHDITRQQVEHVISALEGLLSDSQQGALSAEGGALAALQNAQLRSAAAAFTDSTTRIGLDLKSIAARVSEMASGGNGAQGAERNESFLAGMRRRFASIARSVAELDSLALRTRAAVADLRGTVEQLNDAVQTVQSVESQLGHISLNAMVSACHIGRQGATLHVIAGAIQELKRDCASRSVKAQAALNSIGEVIGAVACGASAGESGDKLLQDLDTRIEDLAAAETSGALVTASVAAQAESLRAGLRDAGEEFRIAHLFSETVRSCCDRLDRLVSQAQPPTFPGTPFGEANSGDAKFGEQSKNRYTMEAERRVHRALSEGFGDAASEGMSAHRLPETEQEVEFF